MLRTILMLSSLTAATVIVAGSVSTGPASAAAGGVGAPSTAKFCATARVLASELPASLGTVDASKAKRLALQLGALTKTAPKEVAGPLRVVASRMKSYANISGRGARVAFAQREQGAYAEKAYATASYVSQYCAAPVPTSPNLPGVGAAKQTACLQDQDTIKQAEDLYSSVNGTYASITELVSAQFLHQVSSYYTDVRIDDPPGGYTLVAVPSGPCANVPVAG